MSETITISTSSIITVVLAVFGAIATIGKGVEWIGKLITALRKPETTQNDRLDGMDTRIKKLEDRMDADRILYMQYFERDKDKLDDVQEGMAVIIRAMLATISHAINGNDTDALRREQGSLQDYLTKHVGS